jgi:hypothetical protein
VAILDRPVGVQPVGLCGSPLRVLVDLFGQISEKWVG